MNFCGLCVILLSFLVTCADGRKGFPFRSRYARSYAKKALKMHNYFRGIHKATPLNLSARLNARAMTYARKLAGLQTAVEENPVERQQQGQNVVIWCARKGTLPAKSAVRTWYREVCNYDFTRAKWSPQTRHFTQLVWKSTKFLGIGVAYNRSCTYVVARYQPAGNTPGFFTKNVRKGNFERRKTCSDRRRPFWFQ